MTTDRVAWLNACYDRAEQRARAATPGPWTAVGREPFESFAGKEGFYRYEIDAGESTTARFNPTTRQHESVPCRNLVVGPGYEGGGITEAADAEYIADHDPSWRLAEIARHRAILAIHRTEPDDDKRHWRMPVRACVGCGWDQYEEASVEDINGCPVVCLLAEEFAGEPGYAEMWGSGGR